MPNLVIATKLAGMRPMQQLLQRHCRELGKLLRRRLLKVFLELRVGHRKANAGVKRRALSRVRLDEMLGAATNAATWTYWRWRIRWGRQPDCRKKVLGEELDL